MNKFVQIGDFILDVVLRETHKLTSEVTKFPIEEGGNFSDNIRPNPMEFSVDGIVTNAPLPSGQSAQLAKGIPLISQPTPDDVVNVFRSLVTGDPFVKTPNTVKYLRSDLAYMYLKSIWEAGQPVTVRTSLGVFEEMALVDFDTTRQADTGDALKFTASFQQLQIISNERLKSSKTPGYGGKNRRGNKTGYANVGARVLWKRGIQPGGPVIYDTRYVEMRASTLDANKTTWFYVKEQPINIAAINVQVSKVDGRSPNTEVSGFFSLYGKEENRPLTSRETFWLLKDLERDNAIARQRKAEADALAGIRNVQLQDSIDTDRRAAAQARSWASRGAIDAPYDPDILRRPIQDPSKMQRSTMTQQGNGRDPLGGLRQSVGGPNTSKKPLNSSALSNAQNPGLGGILP